MDWEYDKKPTAPGWYAVLICWDTNAGMIPGSSSWTGDRWTSRAVAAWLGGPMDNAEAAKRLAYENE